MGVQSKKCGRDGLGDRIDRAYYNKIAPMNIKYGIILEVIKMIISKQFCLPAIPVVQFDQA